MRRGNIGALRIVMLLVLLAVACSADDSWDAPFQTSVPSGSKIPPRVFQFVEVLPLSSSEPEGWQIACVKALVGQGLPNQPYATSVICEIQVETPLRNRDQGLITRRKAQYAAAAVANEAAYDVLRQAIGVTEGTCIAIRTKMQSLLNDRIAGSRVRRCVSMTGLNGVVTAPPVTWP